MVENNAYLYLCIADATVNTMLADDGGFGLLQLELPGHNVEKESLTPLYHTGQLMTTTTTGHISDLQYQ